VRVRIEDSDRPGKFRRTRETRGGRSSMGHRLTRELKLINSGDASTVRPDPPKGHRW
jgi:hypothetical protein